MMTILILILLFFSPNILYADLEKIETKMIIQPQFYSGAGIIEDSSIISIRRLRLNVNTKHNFENIKLEGKINFDVLDAEPNACFIDIKFLRELRLSMGKLKSPFGMEINTGHANLLTMERSHTSRIIKDTKVAGYMEGLMLHGKIPFNFYYKAGAFNNRDNKIFFYKTYPYPLLSFMCGYEPIKKLNIEYSIVYIKRTREEEAYDNNGNYSIEEKTLKSAFNNAGISYNIKNIFQIKSELYTASKNIYTKTSIKDPLKYATNTSCAYFFNTPAGIISTVLGVEFVSIRKRDDFPEKNFFILTQGIDLIKDDIFKIRLNYYDTYSTKLKPERNNRLIISLWYGPKFTLYEKGKIE